MQTTLRIHDDLYREAKAEAAREGITLTNFLESALRLRLSRGKAAAAGKPHPFPVYAAEQTFPLTSEELKRFAENDELLNDLRKLGLESGEA